MQQILHIILIYTHLCKCYKKQLSVRYFYPTNAHALQVQIAALFQQDYTLIKFTLLRDTCMYSIPVGGVGWCWWWETSGERELCGAAPNTLG